VLHGYCVLHGHRLLHGPPTTFAAQHDGDANDSDPTNHGADDDARWVAPFDWIVGVHWRRRVERRVGVHWRRGRMMGMRRVRMVAVPAKELTPFVMLV
jgi:hypothetical protein